MMEFRVENFPKTRVGLFDDVLPELSQVSFGVLSPE